MKLIHKTLVFFFLIFLFSCQNEDIPSVIEMEESQNLEVTSNFKRTYLTEPQTRGAAIERSVFERRMQWASYITAKVLLNNENARSTISTMLTNNQNTIPLENLVGDNITDPNIILFKNSFINVTEDFMSYPHEVEIPLNPLPERDVPIPPFPILKNSETYNATLAAAEFLAFFTDESCVELYFPNNLNFTGSFSISSTAHPLIGDVNVNNGFKRKQIDQSSLNAINIDMTYVTQNSNIIVARPIRDTTPTCDYDEFWRVEDFTDFLSY